MLTRPVKKILIIRFRRVGDAVISSVLCSSLKKSFPESEIHYVLNQAIAPLFENHPDIEKLITFSDAEQKSFTTYVSKILNIVKEGKYDIIIDTRSTIKTLWFSFFSLNTPIRIGRKKIYNLFIQNYRIPLVRLDEVSNTLKLLDPLHCKFEIKEVRNFRLYVTDEERSAFSKKMIDCGIDLNKPIIVCAVTARLEHKIWAKEKMVDALNHILSEYPTAQLVFNYAGEREKLNAETIFHTLNNHSRVFINLEANNLRELLALFSYSSFFFGNEGGPRHISQAMDVPSFAIFPPKTPKLLWLPNISERFQGIELADINLTAAQDDSLSFEQKFDLIDTGSVWEGLNQMLQRHLKTV